MDQTIDRHVTFNVMKIQLHRYCLISVTQIKSLLEQTAAELMPGPSSLYRRRTTSFQAGLKG